ncbi:hypothetical protein BH18GEM1_BH18GEM1_06130 [soil metagenome]
MRPGSAAVGRLVASALCLTLSACSEEDRKAWVSILPLPEGGDADTLAADASGVDLALGADSTAVLLGPDTLFTLDRLPSRGLGGALLAPARIRSIAFSPDSSQLAFTTLGVNSAIGIWSRPRQVASVAAVFAGGVADTIAWSPDGRFLAYGGRTVEGVDRSGLYDAGIGMALRHPVVEWLELSSRGVTVQGWTEGGRLRVLVAPDTAVAPGGLAYVWDGTAGNFTVESHIAPLSESAPRGVLPERGGVFSVDLLGDAAPETVALFRSSDGGPGALVVESRESEHRAQVSAPLLPAGALGFKEWGEARAGPTLHLIAPLGGRATLLLRLPSAEPALRAIGLFQAQEGAGLVPVMARTEEGEVPAIFYDGRAAGVTVQMGLVDLDGDGALEVISATGRPVSGPPRPSVSWGVTVYDWSNGRLVPAPELEDAALERVLRATSGGQP